MSMTMTIMNGWSHKYLMVILDNSEVIKGTFPTSGVHYLWQGSLAVVFEEAIEKVHHDVQQAVEAVVDAGDYQVGGTEGHINV